MHWVFYLLFAATRAQVTGAIDFGTDGSMSLEWALSPDATGPGAGVIRFSLFWDSPTCDTQSWGAFGLHPAPGSGMADAEIFMCSVGTSGKPVDFCQVRNSKGGYVTPAVDDGQYIELESATTDGCKSTAIFSRSVKANPSSPLSYDIVYNKTMGLIYARGLWGGGGVMPAGYPQKHQGTAGRSQVNFFDPSPTAPTPAPTPTPKKPGVWPMRWLGLMTIAVNQEIVNGQLGVSVYSRLHYSFPDRKQLWEWWTIDEPRKSLGGELWVGNTLYGFNADRTECGATDMGFSILKPNWLENTTYSTTNFLLREPPAGAAFSNYTLADLYKTPNTLGMTNSWLVADSKIGEPVRLMGPAAFNHPDWRSIQEFSLFKSVDSFPAGTFDIPASCHPPSSGKLKGRRKPKMRPAMVLWADLAKQHS